MTKPVPVDPAVGAMWRLRATGVADREGRVAVLVPVENAGRPPSMPSEPSRYMRLGGDVLSIDGQGGVFTSSTVESADAAGETPASLTAGALRLVRVVLLVPDEDPTVRDPQTWSKERALAMLVERSEALTALRTPLRTIAALLDAVGHPVVVRWSAAVSVDDVLDAVFDVAAPGGPIRVAPEVETAVIATASVRVGGIFRGPFLDALALPEGRTAVLSAHLGGAHLRILDRTESAVWHAADGAPLGELLMRVGRLTAGRQAGVSHAEAMTTLHAEGLLREEPSWSVRATAAWVAEDERTTVLDLAAGPSRLLALDGSAHWIWTILAERSSLTERDLVDECARLFGVAADSIAADVRGLLEQLRNEGLLRPT